MGSAITPYAAQGRRLKGAQGVPHPTTSATLRENGETHHIIRSRNGVRRRGVGPEMGALLGALAAACSPLGAFGRLVPKDRGGTLFSRLATASLPDNLALAT